MIQALDKEIHVYRLSLHPASGLSPLDNLESVLSSEEQERKQRYRHEQARAAFVRVRVALRYLLSRYLHTTPKQIDIAITDKGKPYLTKSRSSLDLQFNLSHSGQWALLAVSLNTAIGIDVEQHRALTQRNGIAKRCFSSAEFQWWQNLPESLQIQQFYRFWCGKEAFAKATGVGIGIGLEKIELDLQDTVRLVSVPPAFGLVQNWQIEEIKMDTDYTAALCYDGSKKETRILNALEMIF